MEAKVVDPETGELVGVGKEGELLIKGPNVALGYINNPEATEKSFRDGFYWTGDLVECDEMGRFTIKGWLVAWFRAEEVLTGSVIGNRPAQGIDQVQCLPGMFEVDLEEEKEI